jgi:hypothetical protein
MWRMARVQAVSIQDRAEDDLRFIRRAMERSGTFTAVPGYGGAAMGAVGVAATAMAALQPTATRWLSLSSGSWRWCERRDVPACR